MYFEVVWYDFVEIPFACISVSFYWEISDHARAYCAGLKRAENAEDERQREEARRAEEKRLEEEAKERQEKLERMAEERRKREPTHN